MHGILISFMVSTCSLAKDNCCVVLSDLYFLSLLLTDTDISRFLSLFMVNIALRVSASWDILSPHLSLKYSAIVLECLLLDRNVRGILTS